MLINCAVYQEGTKLRNVPTAEISNYVSQSDCFVWVALHDAEPVELEEMQREFDLHALAVEDAHHGRQRPKIEEYGESLFTVMHLLEMVDGELQVGELDVFAGKIMYYQCVIVANRTFLVSAIAVNMNRIY